MKSPAPFDTVIVGGGPAGATAAHDLAQQGWSVLLLDRAGRIKPCGGAIPPRLLREFNIPDSLLVARIAGARIVSPSARVVDMPIDNGFVGMVDRDVFDEWLRIRAAQAGAERRIGTFERFTRDESGVATLLYRDPNGELQQLRARAVIGADGARSALGRQTIAGADRTPCVFAYHEIVRSPEHERGHFDGQRCDVYYDGSVSPDFYGWIFPHGATTSVGVGSAQKGFALRSAVAHLRQMSGLEHCDVVRREGAPIPLRPLGRWDNGRDVVLAGDAAGVVAPASGEGIYYAMFGGRLAGEAADAFLRTGKATALAQARKRFMRTHGRVFWILRLMQWFWYSSDARRERFVTMCRDPDVQKLTWSAYMNKELVRSNPGAHARVFFKDMAHLLRLVRP